MTRTVAVAKRNPNELVLLDADTGEVRGRTPLPGFVRHLQLAGPGGPVLVPVESANAVVRVDLPGGTAQAPIVVGTVPHDVTQAPNGTVMAADELGGTVSAVRGDQVVKVFTDAVQPAGIVPVGNIVGMVDVRKNTLTTYDVDTLRIVGEVPSGAGPTHMVADRHGRMIATDTRGDAVIVFEPTSGPNGGPREVARVAQPGGPYGITYDPARDRAYVALLGHQRGHRLRHDARRSRARSDGSPRCRTRTPSASTRRRAGCTSPASPPARSRSSTRPPRARRVSRR